MTLDMSVRDFLAALIGIVRSHACTPMGRMADTSTAPHVGSHHLRHADRKTVSDVTLASPSATRRSKLGSHHRS